MKKSTQSSFAARIGKAEVLYNTMKGFDDFSPGDASITLQGIRAYIDSLYELQDEHAARYNAFTSAVQTRRKLFTGDKALSRTMTMVKNYVKALYGATSDKSRNINAIAIRIRGEKPVTVANASGESSISRSEKSYGAQLVNLLYLISTLNGFGDDYAPKNHSITIDALVLLSGEIKAANDNFVLAYQALHPLVVRRQEAFIELSARVQRIKQMALAQYGSQSLEYKSIKGLDFRMGRP